MSTSHRYRYCLARVVTPAWERGRSETRFTDGPKGAGRKDARIEDAAFNLSLILRKGLEIDQALAGACTFVADPERLQLLTIYERRIHGNMTKPNERELLTKPASIPNSLKWRAYPVMSRSTSPTRMGSFFQLSQLARPSARLAA